MKTKRNRSFRFSFLTGDCNWQDYGGKFISERMNNGDWDYYLVLEFTNMDDACGYDNKGQPPFHVQLSTVAPQAVPEAERNRALSCMGQEDEDWDEMDPVQQVEILHSYGISAPNWDSYGTSAKALMRQAREEAAILGITFGFNMDAPKNRIGSTGWDFLTGDITAGLRRYSEQDSTEKQLMRKISGLPVTLDDALQAEIDRQQDELRQLT